jgi:hypothetical protein
VIFYAVHAVAFRETLGESKMGGIAITGDVKAGGPPAINAAIEH